MIKLTAPNGAQIMIRADAIDEISVNDGSFEGKSIISLNGRQQAVLETVQEIDAILRANK